MKKVLVSTLILGTLMTPIKNTNAAAAVYASFTGIGATLAVMALGGVTGMGFQAWTEGSARIHPLKWVVLAVGAIVFLDGDNGREVQFQEVDSDKLLALGLTERQAQAYNENVQELSALFNTATRSGSEEISSQIWQDGIEVYGQDAIDGLALVIKASQEEVQ